MKRSILTIKQYDYTSKENFVKDVAIMHDKGYTLVQDGTFGGIFNHGKVEDGEWKYTATFYKSDMA